LGLRIWPPATSVLVASSSPFRDPGMLYCHPLHGSWHCSLFLRFSNPGVILGVAGPPLDSASILGPRSSCSCVW
jgi:hypothetical protein